MRFGSVPIGIIELLVELNIEWAASNVPIYAAKLSPSARSQLVAIFGKAKVKKLINADITKEAALEYNVEVPDKMVQEAMQVKEAKESIKKLHE